MTPKAKKYITCCLAWIAATLLWFCWYVSETTYHSCTVPGVGEFSFSITPTITNIFIGNGGSTLKTIRWEKPDGSEVRYNFGLSTHGFWDSSFLLVEENGRPRGLLLRENGDDDLAYLEFASGNFYYWDYGEMVADGNTVRRYFPTSNHGERMPADLHGRLLSTGSPGLLRGLLALGFNLLWPLLLLANFVALLVIIGVLLFMLVRQRREQEEADRK